MLGHTLTAQSALAALSLTEPRQPDRAKALLVAMVEDSLENLWHFWQISLPALLSSA